MLERAMPLEINAVSAIAEEATGHCRMEDLEHEVTVSPLPTMEEAQVAAQSITPGARAGLAMAMLFGTPAGRSAGGYRASLVARVHLRLGMWRWTISEANKARRCRNIHTHQTPTSGMTDCAYEYVILAES